VNLPHLLAATSSVVFFDEGDFVALAERTDVGGLKSDEHLGSMKPKPLATLNNFTFGNFHCDKPFPYARPRLAGKRPSVVPATQVWERALPMRAGA
jgi:hypothetical protein